LVGTGRRPVRVQRQIPILTGRLSEASLPKHGYEGQGEGVPTEVKFRKRRLGQGS
jgi:hypothetical protein